MKVTYLHHLEATGGGTLTYIRMLQRFAPAGVGFVLFDRDLDDFARKPGHETTMIYRGSSNPVWAFFRVLVMSYLLFRRLRPAVVHAHATVSGAVVRFLQPFFGYRCLYTPHCFTHTYPHRLGGRMFYRSMEKFLGQYAGEYIHVSAGDQSEGVALVPDSKSRVIRSAYNPQTEICDPAEQAHCKRILVVGGNRAQKGYEILPRVQHLLDASKSELGILLVGTRALRRQLESVPWQEDLSRYYRNAFCLLNVSHSEGASLAVIDALYMGLPVVSFDIPSNRELLDAGCGVLVRERSAKALTDALRVLQGDPDRYREIAERGRMRALSRHAPETFSASYMALYDECGIDCTMNQREGHQGVFSQDESPLRQSSHDLTSVASVEASPRLSRE